MDMSLFGHRLNITVDWYDKITDDLLRERNIAPSSGFDRMWVNDGKIRNTGIELTVDGIMYSSRDWKVGGTLMFTRNRNSVLSLGDAVESGLMTDPNTGMQYEYYGNSSGQFRGYTNILAIGQPMYVFYGYKTDGIVQSLEEGLVAGLTGKDAEPGEFKYVDINGDSTVDENDRCIIGDPNPDFLASLSLDVAWKNLDASIFFNGVFGNDVINTQAFGQPNNNPLRWTTDNPNNNYPKLRDDRQTRSPTGGWKTVLSSVSRPCRWVIPFRFANRSSSWRASVSTRPWTTCSPLPSSKVMTLKWEPTASTAEVILV